MSDCSRMIEEGRFAAGLFLQSLADHGDAMLHEEAGAAFASAVWDEMKMAGESVDSVATLRLMAYLSRIGEALWRQSEKEREERNALAFDLGELRRLIAHAQEAADAARVEALVRKTAAGSNAHLAAVGAVVKDLRAIDRLINIGDADTAAGRQAATVISMALASTTKKKGGAA